MGNARIGTVGGICAALLGVAAVVVWVQGKSSDQAEGPPEGTASYGQDANFGRNDRLAGNDPTARLDEVASKVPAEPPSVSEAAGAAPIAPEEPGPGSRVRSPGMAKNHPLAFPPSGWDKASGLNELGAIENPDIGITQGVFVDSPHRQSVWGARRSAFHPSNPDGTLGLRVTAFDFEGQDTSARFEAVVIRLRDRASWRIAASGSDTVDFLLPVSDGDTFQVQLRADDGRAALGYLPVPGSLSRGSRPGSTRDLYRRGTVVMGLRLIAPDQQPRARGVQVLDASGQPVAGAAILQGGQEFGRSDSAGMIDWPFPPTYPADPVMREEIVGRTGSGEPITRKVPDQNWPPVPERGFMLSAPGYVPVFLPRGEVADAGQAALQVRLMAREFVASVQGAPIDYRFMCLAANIPSSDGWHSKTSEILSLGWDLLPLEPSAQVATWDDAYYYLAFNGYGRERWAELRKLGKTRCEPTSLERHRVSARPFTKGWVEPGDGSWQSPSWGDGLEAAVGRPYHELWPDFYGGWYNGRWKYEAGQFDVVLPYPGKFLLLVGEEYREGMNSSTPGQVNHVLYIDALDPANVKGELFRCPD